MQTLFEALPIILKKAGADPEAREGLAFALWRKVVGEGISRFSTPLSFEDRTLTVAVSDKTWKKQLESLAADYQQRINRLLADLDIEQIVFKVDARAVRQAAPAAEQNPHTFNHTDEIMRDLQPVAEKIADERLREIFLHAAARSIERKDERESGS